MTPAPPAFPPPAGTPSAAAQSTAAQSAAAQTIAVMDVGGSHVTAAAVAISDESFTISGRTELPLDSSGPREAILGTLGRSAEAVGPDERWAVAMPGPFDYARGTGGFEGIGKFGALAGLDLRSAVAGLVGVSPSAVSFVNDAVAYGIGEWAFGAGRRAERLVCLTLGTGVGSAFLDGGTAVDSGDTVPLKGEAHTIQLDGAPLEHTVSTAAIRRAYARAGSGGADRVGGAAAASSAGVEASVEEIFARARDGERLAATVVTSTMSALGRALGPWILRFDAHTTVIGGAMSQSWDLVEGPLGEALAAAGAETVLRAATLRDEAPLVGAAAWATRS